MNAAEDLPELPRCEPGPFRILDGILLTWEELQNAVLLPMGAGIVCAILQVMGSFSKPVRWCVHVPVESALRCCAQCCLLSAQKPALSHQ